MFFAAIVGGLMEADYIKGKKQLSFKYTVQFSINNIIVYIYIFNYFLETLPFIHHIIRFIY